MALIICPECGKEISSRATSCPHCGCPITEETLSEVNNEQNIENRASQLMSMFGGVISDVANTTIDSINRAKSLKHVGWLEIDEENRCFRIIKGQGIIPSKSSGSKLLKGTAALATGGLSLVAEKALSGVVKSNWYSFDDLISYQQVVDNARERTTSTSSARFGGFGAKQRIGTSKNVTHKASLLLKMNSLDEPIIEMKFITKPLSGRDFDIATKAMRETAAALDIIIRNRRR